MINLQLQLQGEEARGGKGGRAEPMDRAMGRNPGGCSCMSQRGQGDWAGSGQWLRATAGGEGIPLLYEVPGHTPWRGWTLARASSPAAALPHPHGKFALCPSKMPVEFNMENCSLPFFCKLSPTQTCRHIPWR